MISAQLRDAIGFAVESGQTYYEIAKKSGVDWRVVSEFHSGQRTAIRIATADALCEYFGLELAEKKPGTAPKEAGKKPGTAPKQATKKPATTRKRPKKSAE